MQVTNYRKDGSKIKNIADVKIKVSEFPLLLDMLERRNKNEKNKVFCETDTIK